MRSRAAGIVLLGIGCLAAACDETASEAAAGDGAAPPDASLVGPDAGIDLGGGAPDRGIGVDAGAADRGAGIDAGLLAVDAGAPDAGSDAGAVDAGAPDAARPGCLEAVVQVEIAPSESVEIFAYEASRSDASDATAGADDGRACSRRGVLPWSRIDVVAARAACAASGFELCDGATWRAVCAGDGRIFPYGQVHVDRACNDHVSGSERLEPTGAFPDCRTPEGIYDLSGNLWELTSDLERRGASYKVNAVMYQTENAGCDRPFDVNPDYLASDVGFRCCRWP